MPIRFFLLLPLLLGMACEQAMAEDRIIIRHYQHHPRYDFGLRLLELAMSRLSRPFEIRTPDRQYVNEKRGEAQVIEGRLDVQWMSTTENRERQMIAVHEPIYRGILGLRLLLVRPDRAPALSRIADLEGLRGFTGGHGLHWGDLPVYAANGLQVVTNARYEALFLQLQRGRFDYFHRGLAEIWGELEKQAKDLVVAEDVMLFYPHPVYFFVTAERPALARLIRLGLTRAIEDGSYRELFLWTFGEHLKRSRLESRRLILLDNPVVPPGTGPLDTSWWMPARHVRQLQDAQPPD